MSDSQFSLTGRTALITGASSGLGVSFAKSCAAAGAKVVLAARRVDRLDALADEIGREHCHVVALDVRSGQSVDDAFVAMDREGIQPDIVVNNAGISRESFLANTPEEEWNSVLETNLRGVHLVSQAAATRLLAAKRPGAIINIASILGYQPGKMLGAYSAAKAAVISLTRTQALEWARFGIRANAIAPGYFPTEINQGFLDSPSGQALAGHVPLGRVGVVGELDGALLLLASDAGAYMAGSVITVDGGLLLRGLS